jgi:hypothetical protein
MVCSLEPSITHVGGTPSRWAKRDSPSWASDFVLIEDIRTHPNPVQNTWAYRFRRCHDTTSASSVSVSMVWDRRLCRSCLSFVLNLHDKVGCITLRIACCVVASMILRAGLRLIPQHLANSATPTVGFLFPVFTLQTSLLFVSVPGKFTESSGRQKDYRQVGTPEVSCVHRNCPNPFCQGIE